jgi:hypothetical protein
MASRVTVSGFAELMQLSGYRVPGAPNAKTTVSVSVALFADISEEEREELLEYLAWYRARHGRRRAPSRA